MTARRVVDAVSPAALCPALKSAELGDQARVIEQLDAARVQERQNVAIDV
jgi:hypothetical protein